MSAIDVSTIKAALHAWVVRGSGLAADHVVFGAGHRSPSGPYISMRIRVSAVGSDSVRVTANPSPSPGADVINTVLGSRICTLTLQCFSDESNGASARSPEQILDDVLTSASLPTVSDALNAAKIGLLTFGDITPIDLVIDSAYFEPRALVEIRFHTVATMSETGGSISSVDVEGTVPAGVFTFTIG